MIKKVLDIFSSKEGNYVSWKNNHQVSLSLRGESDLDVYIPENSKKLFFQILKDNNWISVINPIAHFTDVYHFYTIDENLKNYHLHVYFEIITGESWLKEFKFPIGDFLLQNKIMDDNGIYILNNKAQSFLFVLRHFLKGASFSSRLLYKKEIDSYQKEWDLCKDEFDGAIFQDFINLNRHFENSGLKDKIELPNIKNAIEVRQELNRFLRIPKHKLTYYRIKNFSVRLLNKVFAKKKKILPENGVVLVFSGADGVGKSTMSESISDSFKKFLTVKNVQLGRPQSKFVELLRKLISKNKQTHSIGKIDSSSPKITLKKSLSAVYLAYLRHKMANKALAYKNKNYLVISDRWPTLEYNKMNGHKLDINHQNILYKKLAKIENTYYKKIVQCDLCIILTVPTEIAVLRNNNRIKEGKETDEEIIERHQQNAKHQPISKKNIRFDNNGDLKSKRFELINIIQENLLQIY